VLCKDMQSSYPKTTVLSPDSLENVGIWLKKWPKMPKNALLTLKREDKTVDLGYELP